MAGGRAECRAPKGGRSAGRLWSRGDRRRPRRERDGRCLGRQRRKSGRHRRGPRPGRWKHDRPGCARRRRRTIDPEGCGQGRAAAQVHVGHHPVHTGAQDGQGHQEQDQQQDQLTAGHTQNPSRASRCAQVALLIARGAGQGYSKPAWMPTRAGWVSQPAIGTLPSSVCQAMSLSALEETALTKGNLSSHLSRLQQAGYVNVEKSSRGEFPLTLYRLAPLGRLAFEAQPQSLLGVMRGDETAWPAASTCEATDCLRPRCHPRQLATLCRAHPGIEHSV